MGINEIYVNNCQGKIRMVDIMDNFMARLYNQTEEANIIHMMLFGSYVRGTQTEDSDIDLCIVFDEKSVDEMNLNILVDTIADQLLDQYGVIIHALCFRNAYYEKNKNNSLLFLDIKKEGLWLK